MSRIPEITWVGTNYGKSDLRKLAKALVQQDGAAVLRGRGIRNRRTLAALVADLPAGLVGHRVNSSSDEGVTTVVVHPAGTPIPGFFEPDDQGPL